MPAEWVHDAERDVLEFVHASPHVVSDVTVTNAFALLEALPAWASRPDIVIEEDGEVGLDWNHSLGHNLTLNIGEHMLGFAGLNGGHADHGRVRFTGVIPAHVISCLRSMVVDDAR
jgi:hypothetical protein